MSNFSDQELDEALVRVFRDQKDSTYIHFDGRTAQNEFLRAGWYRGLEKGWLEVESVELEQETFLKGFLTPRGKKELLKECCKAR